MDLLHSADEAEPRCMHVPSMAFPMDNNKPSEYVFTIARQYIPAL
jgi:hypothetical protein